MAECRPDTAEAPGQYGVRLPGVHRSTERTPDYGSGDGGSNPPGRTQARLAQWESTWPTPRGRRFDSFAEHWCLLPSWEGAGLWSLQGGFDSRRAPQAGVSVGTLSGL